MLAPMLWGLGVRLLGDDPAVHHAAPLWGKLCVESVSVQQLLACADAVSLNPFTQCGVGGEPPQRLHGARQPGRRRARRDLQAVTPLKWSFIASHQR